MKMSMSVCVSLLLPVLTVAQVQLSTGQQYSDPTLALTNSSSDLSVSFLSNVPIASLGFHPSLSLVCHNSSLDIVVPLMVSYGMIVRVQNCTLTSSLVDGALFTIFGSLAIENCTMHSIPTKGFLVFSWLLIENSWFYSNKDSIIWAISLGFTVHVTNCRFLENSSEIGTIFQLIFLTSQAVSHTNVSLTFCHFAHNSASVVGAFLHLDSRPGLALSLNQTQEYHEMVISDSQFEGTPGYFCFFSVPYFRLAFLNSTFVSMNHVFALELVNAELVVQNCRLEVSGRVIESTYLSGIVSLQAVFIEGIVVGPAILVFNQAMAGWIYIEDLTITRSRLSPRTFFTCSIMAINTAVQVSGLRVLDSTSSVGMGGIYSFSAVHLQDVQVQNVTFNGGVLIILGCTLYCQDLYVHNVTMKYGVTLDVVYSQTQVINLTVDIGDMAHGFQRNTLWALDSNVSVQTCVLIFPPEGTSSAFSLWNTHFVAVDVWFRSLYSDLVKAVEYSNAVLVNISVQDFDSANVILSAHSVVSLDQLTLTTGQVRASFLSAFAQSHVTLSRTSLLSGNAQSLVVSSYSTVLLTSLAFKFLSADTLFWYIVASQIEVYNVTIASSTLDLTQLHFSSLVLHTSSFSRIAVRRRFITLSHSNLTLVDSSIEGVTATSVTPLCTAKYSAFRLLSSRLAHFTSLEQNLMEIAYSDFTLESSVAAEFNATLLVGVRSNVTVLDSVVLDGGPLQVLANQASGGCFACTGCTVLLRASIFDRVKGLTGGVLSIKFSSRLDIQRCQFNAGTADYEGGFIFAKNTPTYISTSSFSQGRASTGGAVYVDCDSHITECVFANNSAVQGGAVGWTKVRPVYLNITAENNTAEYGSFEASLVTHIALVPSNVFTLKGVAGINVVPPILIGFYDESNQLVTTDYASIAELRSPAILGTSHLIAQRGVANFSSILIQSLPGQSLVIEVFSASINATFPGTVGAHYSFTYEVRVCEPGEVTTAVGCYLCPKNTFSIEPSDSQCSECPHYASCPGGSTLDLAPGYWRSSALSSQVYQCPIAAACEGGTNSTCAEGYESVQCSRCSEGHYFLALCYCVSCEALLLRLLRLSFALLVSIAGWIILARSGNQSVLLVLKIAVEFCQSLLILPYINVNWGTTLMHYFAINEMIFSFSVSGLNLECLATAANLYHKAVAAALVPVLVVLLLIGVNCFREAFWPQACRSYWVFVWLYRPYLLKTVLTLLACRQVSGQWLLSADVGLTCWDQDHWKYLLGLCLPGLLCTVVVYPLVLWTRIRRNKLEVASLLAPYTRTARYSCLLASLKQALYFAAVVCLGTTEDTVQMLVVAGILYCFLHWHIYKKPYEGGNVMEGVSELLQTYLCASGFYFTARLSLQSSVLAALSSFLFFLIVSFLVACAVWLFKLKRRVPVETSWEGLAPAPSVVSQAAALPSDLQLIELNLVNMSI